MMQSVNPKTEKSKQTKAKILAIAKKVFEQKGFQKATVKDITSLAELGYGTFYLYFKDKKEVFNALVEQVEGELYTAAEGGSDLELEYERGINSYRALRKDLRAILKSFYENRSILKFSRELALLDEEFKKKYNSMKARLIKRTRQVLEKSGLDSVNLDVAAVGIAGMIEAVAVEWTNDEDSNIEAELNLEEVLPTLTKLYFKAVS
jgi:AcrR family transcriptional regulator